MRMLMPACFFSLVFCLVYFDGFYVVSCLPFFEFFSFFQTLSLCIRVFKNNSIDF